MEMLILFSLDKVNYILIRDSVESVIAQISTLSCSYYCQQTFLSMFSTNIEELFQWLWSISLL